MDILHVRVISPAPSTSQVEAVLTRDEAVVRLVVLPGAARAPDGDLVEFDVVREGATPLCHSLAADRTADG